MTRVVRRVAALLALIVLLVLPAAVAGATVAVREERQATPQAVRGSLLVAPDGRLWTIGDVVYPGVHRGRIDVAGRVRWSRIGGLPELSVSDSVVGDDGAIYVAGWITRGRDRRGRLLKIDTSTGRAVWLRSVHGVPCAVIARPGGGVFVLNEVRTGRVRLGQVRTDGTRAGGEPTVPMSGTFSSYLAAPLALDGSGRPVVLGYVGDSWALARLGAGGRWTTRTLDDGKAQPGPVYTSVVRAGRALWVFGDEGDARGSIAQVTATTVVPVRLPAVIPGASCEQARADDPRTDPAFGGAGIAGPDGALWLRAGCYDDFPSPLTPGAWLRVAAGPSGPTIEVVPIAGTPHAGAGWSLAVGTARTIWSLDDGDQGGLVRTVVPRAAR